MNVEITPDSLILSLVEKRPRGRPRIQRPDSPVVKQKLRQDELEKRRRYSKEYYQKHKGTKRFKATAAIQAAKYREKHYKLGRDSLSPISKRDVLSGLEFDRTPPPRVALMRGQFGPISDPASHLDIESFRVEMREMRRFEREARGFDDVEMMRYWDRGLGNGFWRND